MTPQGQAAAPQPQQPGWFSRNWKWLAAAGCVMAFGCCGLFGLVAYLGSQQVDPELTRQLANLAGDDAARVDCGTPGPGGVDCDLKRTGGARRLNACWDLEITCANGGKMVGHACGDIAAGAPSGTVNMPVASFSNQDGCDAPKSGAVVNLVVKTYE